MEHLSTRVATLSQNLLRGMTVKPKHDVTNVAINNVSLETASICRMAGVKNHLQRVQDRDARRCKLSWYRNRWRVINSAPREHSSGITLLLLNAPRRAFLPRWAIITPALTPIQMPRVGGLSF